MTNAILRGKPDAGNPHVRFDEGEVASAKPRRGSLLYKQMFALAVFCFHSFVTTSAYAAHGGRVRPRLDFEYWLAFGFGALLLAGAVVLLAFIRTKGKGKSFFRSLDRVLEHPWLLSIGGFFVCGLGIRSGVLPKWTILSAFGAWVAYMRFCVIPNAWKRRAERDAAGGIRKGFASCLLQDFLRLEARFSWLSSETAGASRALRMIRVLEGGMMFKDGRRKQWAEGFSSELQDLLGVPRFPVRLQCRSVNGNSFSVSTRQGQGIDIFVAERCWDNFNSCLLALAYGIIFHCLRVNRLTYGDLSRNRLFVSLSAAYFGFGENMAESGGELSPSECMVAVAFREYVVSGAFPDKGESSVGAVALKRAIRYLKANMAIGGGGVRQKLDRQKTQIAELDRELDRYCVQDVIGDAGNAVRRKEVLTDLTRLLDAMLRADLQSERYGRLLRLAPCFLDQMIRDCRWAAHKTMLKRSMLGRCLMPVVRCCRRIARLYDVKVLETEVRGQ